MHLTSGMVEADVVSVNQAGDVTTVELATAVLDNTLAQVDVSKKPPKFSYLYAAHDKLWGFGLGAISALGMENPEGRGTVYYTDGFSDESAWYNENGLMQYINMADKLPTSDSLVGMGEKDGFTVFFFRHHIQVWSGYDPSVNGDMTWQKTIPIGAVHGDLIVSLQNDLLFFTRSGVRSLSRVMQTEQLDIADVGGEMDVDLTQAVKLMLRDDAVYRQAHSFQQPEQGWFGFYVAGKTYVFQVSDRGVGWALFDGLFLDVSASMLSVAGDLYLAVGEHVYLYDVDAYSDMGQPITCRWWTPWLKRSSGAKSWANKYVELVSDQRVAGIVLMKRFKNYNNSSYVTGTIPLPKPEDYWDAAYWDEALFDHAHNGPLLVQDRYVADVYSYAFEASSTDGPLTLYGFKLYGVSER